MKLMKSKGIEANVVTYTATRHQITLFSHSILIRHLRHSFVLRCAAMLVTASVGRDVEILHTQALVNACVKAGEIPRAERPASME